MEGEEILKRQRERYRASRVRENEPHIIHPFLKLTLISHVNLQFHYIIVLPPACSIPFQCSIPLTVDSCVCICIDICTVFAHIATHCFACKFYVHRLLVLFQLTNFTENQPVYFFLYWVAIDYLHGILASMPANMIILSYGHQRLKLW